MSSAAFRPSPVILSMLSTAGSTRSFFNRSARSVRVRMNAFSSGLAGAAAIAGLPFSELGSREVQHIGRLHVGHGAEHQKAIRED